MRILTLLLLFCSFNLFAAIGQSTSSYTLASTNAAATNVSILQNALSQAGLVNINCTGDIQLVNNTSTIKSNTNLKFSPNCNIKLADASYKSFLKNENFASTPITLSSLTIASNGTVVTATCSATCPFADGSYVYIAGADTTSPGIGGQNATTVTESGTIVNGTWTDNYNGVYKIKTLTATTFSYDLSFHYNGTIQYTNLTSPASVNSQYVAAGFGIQAMKADANITISGGNFDCNHTNNTTGGTQNDAYWFYLRRISNLTITDQTTKDCRNSYMLNNIYTEYLDHLTSYNTRSFIQHTGSGRNISIGSVTTYGNSDDSLAFLNSDYCQTSGPYAGDYLGWFSGININNVQVLYGYSGIKLTGQTGFKYENIHLGTFYGKMSGEGGAVVITTDDATQVTMAGNSSTCVANVPGIGTNTSGTYIDKFSIDNIQVTNTLNGLSMSHTGKSVFINSMQVGLADLAGVGAIQSYAFNYNGIIDSMTINSLYAYNTTNANTGSANNVAILQANEARNFNIGTLRTENLKWAYTQGGSASWTNVNIDKLMTVGNTGAINIINTPTLPAKINIQYAEARSPQGSPWINVATSKTLSLNIVSGPEPQFDNIYPDGSLYLMGDTVIGGGGKFTCFNCNGIGLDIGLVTTADGVSGIYTHPGASTIFQSATTRGTLVSKHPVMWDGAHWIQTDSNQVATSTVVNTGSFVVGETYQILTLGTGATFPGAPASPVVGTMFRATGAGTAGSPVGTAALVTRNRY